MKKKEEEDSTNRTPRPSRMKKNKEGERRGHLSKRYGVGGKRRI